GGGGGVGGRGGQVWGGRGGRASARGGREVGCVGRRVQREQGGDRLGIVAGGRQGSGRGQCPFRSLGHDRRRQTDRDGVDAGRKRVVRTQLDRMGAITQRRRHLGRSRRTPGRDHHRVDPPPVDQL